MKYFLIAGEASGDMHAARLITALRQRDNEAVMVGLGGDKMQAAGCRLYQHYRNMAYMGYVAVLTHLKDIRTNIRIAEQALLSERPTRALRIIYHQRSGHGNVGVCTPSASIATVYWVSFLSSLTFTPATVTLAPTLATPLPKLSLTTPKQRNPQTAKRSNLQTAKHPTA